jgi:hypothetical protein
MAPGMIGLDGQSRLLYTHLEYLPFKPLWQGFGANRFAPRIPDLPGPVRGADIREPHTHQFSLLESPGCRLDPGLLRRVKETECNE